MKKKPRFKVIYNSDPRLIIDNHISQILFLTDVDECYFYKLSDAIRFLNECTSPITNAEDLVPELRNCDKVIQWILAEQNITTEHILVGNIELAMEKR